MLTRSLDARVAARGPGASDLTVLGLELHSLHAHVGVLLHVDASRSAPLALDLVGVVAAGHAGGRVRVQGAGGGDGTEVLASLDLLLVSKRRLIQ